MKWLRLHKAAPLGVPGCCAPGIEEARVGAGGLAGLAGSSHTKVVPPSSYWSTSPKPRLEPEFTFSFPPHVDNTPECHEVGAEPGPGVAMPASVAADQQRNLSTVSGGGDGGGGSGKLECLQLQEKVESMAQEMHMLRSMLHAARPALERVDGSVADAYASTSKTASPRFDLASCARGQATDDFQVRALRSSYSTNI